MPIASDEPFDLYSADEVPDSYAWPSSYLHAHPVACDSISSNSIPIIDVSSPAAASLIGSACRSLGAFYATGHGIPAVLLDEVEHRACSMFSLPLHRKLVWARQPGLVSGYGRPPLSAFFPKLMWSEGFTIAGDRRGDVAGEHRFFCDVMETYNKKMKEMAMKLLRLMLQSLNLDEEETVRTGFLEELSEATSVLQLNSYPACPEPEKAIGMAAHTDSGLFSVLHQTGGCSGLQILREETGSGPVRWVDVPPLKGALIINVGDLLQILSNGQFKSVCHRAVVNRAVNRLSAAYIIGPPGHFRVEPMSKLIEPNRGPRYRSVTWPEYLRIRAQLFDRALESVTL